MGIDKDGPKYAALDAHEAWIMDIIIIYNCCENIWKWKTGLDGLIILRMGITTQILILLKV